MSAYCKGESEGCLLQDAKLMLRLLLLYFWSPDVLYVFYSGRILELTFICIPFSSNLLKISPHKVVLLSGSQRWIGRCWHCMFI